MRAEKMTHAGSKVQCYRVFCEYYNTLRLNQAPESPWKTQTCVEGTITVFSRIFSRSK